MLDIIGVKWRKPVPTYAVIVWMNFGGFGKFGESVELFLCGFGRLDFKFIYVWSSIEFAKNDCV